MSKHLTSVDITQARCSHYRDKLHTDYVNRSLLSKLMCVKYALCNDLMYRGRVRAMVIHLQTQKSICCFSKIFRDTVSYYSNNIHDDRK